MPPVENMEPKPIAYKVGELCVEFRGAGWAIIDGMGSRVCYNTLGQWEIERSPSNRDEAFYARCRYTLEDALRIAREIQEPST